MARLNHAWRVVATGIAFATFGLGGLLLSLTFMPLLYLLVWNVHWRKRIAREIVRCSFMAFLWWMKFLGVVDYDFHADELRRARGKIIIANHPTLIDVVALIALTKWADCVVKAELFRNPFIRAIIRSTGYISNSDPNLLIADCESSLAQGNNLIIFPEGTRTGADQVIKFQRGAANIALRTGASFLALAIECKPRTLRKGEPWFCSPSCKPTLSIRFVREIPLSGYLPSVCPTHDARQLTRDLEVFYQQM